MKQEQLYSIILTQHVSEKATIASQKNNDCVFHVASCATKSSIKEAVEFLFNTRVKKVTIVNVKSKNKTFRGRKGQQKAWKKAYVTLHTDQKLDILSTHQ